MSGRWPCRSSTATRKPGRSTRKCCWVATSSFTSTDAALSPTGHTNIHLGVESAMNDTISRRAMLGRMGGGLGTIAWASMLAREGVAATGPTHFPARAKRVIHLFMNGGPFQADLFDPKPALEKYAGQRPEGADLRTERPTGGLLPSPFKFSPRGQSGVPVSELLPRLGSHIDDICVLRSMHADNPNHGPALMQMNNGTILPTRPSMGAWFLYGLGTENENLPGYIVLCPGRPVR